MRGARLYRLPRILGQATFFFTAAEIYLPTNIYIDFMPMLSRPHCHAPAR